MKVAPSTVKPSGKPVILNDKVSEPSVSVSVALAISSDKLMARPAPDWSSVNVTSLTSTSAGSATPSTRTGKSCVCQGDSLVGPPGLASTDWASTLSVKSALLFGGGVMVKDLLLSKSGIVAMPLTSCTTTPS